MISETGEIAEGDTEAVLEAREILAGMVIGQSGETKRLL
jgi:hypothetical protein